MWKQVLQYCGSLGSDDLKIDYNIYYNKGFKCHFCCKTIQFRNGQSVYSYVN